MFYRIEFTLHIIILPRNTGVTFKNMRAIVGAMNIFIILDLLTTSVRTQSAFSTTL